MTIETQSNQSAAIIQARSSDIIACGQCGLVDSEENKEAKQKIHCKRCDHTLINRSPSWKHRITPLILTSIILFILSNTFSFISIEAGFSTVNTNLLSGVWALINNSQYILAFLVFITIFVFPLVELLALSYVYIARHYNIKPLGTRHCLKFLTHSNAWNMLDIFIVSVLVTSVKLQESATLIPGIGMMSFAGLITALIFINLHIDFDKLWHWYKPNNLFTTDEENSLFACKSCKATIGHTVLMQQNSCPRCRSKIYHRIPNSFQKTLALLITAAILYIPALALPIMTTTSLGRESNDTIISGVVYLFNEGMWFIALVVFIASIVVPILKLITLAYLLWSIHYKHQTDAHIRLRLFKITEFVGRWSMIDVFVITLLVALVQFGIIMNIRPEAAALAFASVVILTMIAVETFDSRLIWDNLTETDSTNKL